MQGEPVQDLGDGQEVVGGVDPTEGTGMALGGYEGMMHCQIPEEF